MKVLELSVSTVQYAKVLGDHHSTVQKPINFNWSKKLLTIQGKYRRFDVVKLVASNRENLFYLLDSITISNGSKEMETSKKRVYFNINLGVEVNEPEED